MQRYEHTLLRWINSERRVVMKFEHHADKPWRNDHMTFRTNWNTLTDDFHFPLNKMLRFQIVEEVVDENEFVFYGEDQVMMPMFHVC